MIARHSSRTLVVRFALAALLNGVLLNLAGYLNARGLLPWQQLVLAPLLTGGLFVTPWVFMARRAADAKPGVVAVRNGLAWLIGGLLPMQVIYSIVVRPMGIALTVMAAFYFLVGGAIAGASGWSLYHALWPGKPDAPVGRSIQ